MEVTAFAELFSNLAVPVACLCAMFYLWNKEREDHKEEMSKLTTALENNTLVMTQIKDRLKID